MATRTNSIILRMERFKGILKTRARNELLSLESIYNTEAMSYPECAAMLSWSRAYIFMLPFRKARLLEYPQTILELCNMFDNNQLDKCNGKDMYKGCIQDCNGMVSAVFVNQAFIDAILRQSPNEMFVDTSFTTIPLKPRFKQLLTIHFLVACQSIPAVFCLMEDVTTVSYDAVFTFIRDKILIGYQSKIITTNFDSNLRSSLNKYFLPEIIHGSWFIHNKAIWEKVTAYGYFDLVGSNYNAFISMKMLMTLPLLPPEKIEDGFRIVKAYATKFNVRMRKLFTYYYFHWLRIIGCQTISVYRNPLRTNNNIEGFHSKLMEMFQERPSIWTFLTCLEKLNEAYPEQLDMSVSDMQVVTRRIVYVLTYSHNLVHYNVQQLDSEVISIEKFLTETSAILNKFVCQELNWTNKIITADNSIMDDNLGSESSSDSRVSSEEENNTALEEDQTPMVIVLSDDDDDGDGRSHSSDGSGHESVHSSHRSDGGSRSDYSTNYSSDSSNHESDQQSFSEVMLSSGDRLETRVRLEALILWPNEERMAELSDPRRMNRRRTVNGIFRPYALAWTVDRSSLSGTALQRAADQPLPIEIESSSESESEVSSQGFCMVCHTKKSKYKFLILPCGHAWLCLKCKQKYMEFCPYCRCTLESYTRILETSI